MSEEAATNPVVGADAPAPEVAPNDTAPETDAVLLTGAAEGAETDADGAAEGGEPGAEGAAKPDADAAEVEIELEGKKYKVPAALQGAFLMQADYTKKTQAVAQAAREIEAARQAFETERQAQVEAIQAEVDQTAAVHALKQSLAQWDRVNWDYLQQQDQENGTNELAKAMLTHNRLKDALAQAQAELTKTQSERQAREAADQKRRAEAEAAEDAKLISEGYQHLVSKIPDWPTVAPQVVNFGAQRFGFSAQEINAVRDPRMFEVLHLAYLGQQALQTKTVTQRVERSQQTQPAPVVGGKAPAARDESRMSTADWIKLRDKQVREASRRR